MHPSFDAISILLRCPPAGTHLRRHSSVSSKGVTKAPTPPGSTCLEHFVVRWRDRRAFFNRCEQNVGDGELRTAKLTEHAGETRSREPSFPRYSSAEGSQPVTALLCFPSCLFNCGVPDCEMQFRRPRVNKSLIFPGLSPESGPFSSDFTGSPLHYSSHIPLGRDRTSRSSRIKCEFSSH